MTLHQQLNLERRELLEFMKDYRKTLLAKKIKIAVFSEPFFIEQREKYYRITDEDIMRLDKTIENLSKPWTRAQAEVVRSRMDQAKKARAIAINVRPMSLNEELNA